MANNIALAKTFVPILDEIYKLASLTSKLEALRSWHGRARTPMS